MNFHFFQIVVKVYIDPKEKAEFLEASESVQSSQRPAPILPILQLDYIYIRGL